MKIINKIFNEKLNDNWNYCEYIEINSGTSVEQFTRISLINNEIDWFEGIDSPMYIYQKQSIELENAYQYMLRKQKLKNILDENY